MVVSLITLFVVPVLYSGAQEWKHRLSPKRNESLS
jgi:hypothetical protein